MEEQQEPRSLDVIYELALQRLDAQLIQLRRVDDKVRFVLGAASIVMAAGAGLISTRTTPLPVASLVFTGLSILAYLAIVVLSVMAYRYLDLSYPPRIRTVWQEALFWEPAVTKRQILSELVEAIEDNRRPLAAKLKYAYLQIYLLPALVISVVLAIVLTI